MQVTEESFDGPFCVPPPHPQLSKLLTCKTAIRFVFILFSLLGIYLTARNRDWTKIEALGSDCAMTRPFAPFVSLTRDWVLCPFLASSKVIGRPSGAGPGGGVQRSGQQGVPLPDKNRFLCARATQIRFSARLAFLVNLARESTPEAFYFALSGLGPHLYNCAVHIAVFNFFLLLTVGCVLCYHSCLVTFYLESGEWFSFPLPVSQVKLKGTVTCREQDRVCSLSILLFYMTSP